MHEQQLQNLVLTFDFAQTCAGWPVLEVFNSEVRSDETVLSQFCSGHAVRVVEFSGHFIETQDYYVGKSLARKEKVQRAVTNITYSKSVR